MKHMNIIARQIFKTVLITLLPLQLSINSTFSAKLVLKTCFDLDIGTEVRVHLLYTGLIVTKKDSNVT